MGNANPALDPARWATLSPRLDELLDLEPAARAERLAEWRADDAHLAGEIEALLETLPRVRSEGFLEDALHATLGASGPGPGSRCGAWTLETVLGTGGMGSVWLAQRSDGRYQAQAAIKLPHPAVLVRGGAERFEREGRLLARVSHPHIAGLLDAGIAASGQPYLVLEYVQGETIDAFCDRKRLAVGERVALFLDVLAAVAHAHGQLVLHRDLKPSNILVDAAGRVKLLDFGIAKLIESEPGAAPSAAHTQRAFTPDHVAPEQLQDEPVGTATDVYALGVLLYQLLCGRHPTALASHTPVERLRAVVETVPLPMPDAAAAAGPESSARRSATPRQLARLLHGDLDTIVAKALKKAPAERYAGAAAFADDLQRWRDGQPVLARPDRAGYRLRLFVRRNRLVVGAAATGVVLLLGGAAATGWQAVVARHERDEARWQAEKVQARGTLYSLMLGQMGGLDAPLTQRQILDQAVRLVESRYSSQPRLAVELLLPIAGQYHTMGDVNADLAVMQLAARLAAASGDAELVASTACSTVDTYIALDRFADAQASVDAGHAALARLAEAPALTQAACWKYEAELALDRGQPTRALASGLRAQRRIEASGKTDSNIYTSLLSLMIFVHRDNGDPASALATVERLAEQVRARSGGGTLEAALVDRSRAVLLADAGELSAARTLAQEVVARFGNTTYGAPTSLLITLAQIELAGGHLAQARALADHAEAASRARGSTEFLRRLAYLRMLIALADGRTGEARRWFEAAQNAPLGRTLRAVSHTPETAHARVLLAEGRTGEAAATVEAELTRLQGAGVANLALLADAWRAAAEIQLAAGNPSRAAAHAQAAQAASTRGARHAEASAHVGHARLLLARARQAQQDTAGAREAAVRAAGPLARGLGADHPLALQARTLAGHP